VSETKKFRKLEKNSIKMADGWTGLLEDICAPADEVDIFDKRVRDPGALFDEIGSIEYGEQEVL
jgi:hypothetical protein